MLPAFNAISRQYQKGFNLLELLVVLLILAIALGVALPAYQRQMDALTMRTTANELLASHRLARSESIRSRQLVSLCASGASTCQSSSAWNDGWRLMSADMDREWLLSAGLSISANNNGVVRFNAQGALVAGSSDRIQLDGPLTSRCLVITSMGRTSIEHGSC